MDLGKQLSRQVKAVLRSYLVAQGFNDFTDLGAWRRGERWIDVVEVVRLGATRFGIPNVIGRLGLREILANSATFSLAVGCYYTDLHLLPWTGPAPERPRIARGESSRYPTCHRVRFLARSFQMGNVQSTLFPVADDGSDMHEVLADALHALRTRGIDWLDSTHDIDTFLDRVDADPASYSEDEEFVELSQEEKAEVEVWLDSRPQEESDLLRNTLGVDVLGAGRRELRGSLLRDHTALDSLPPMGDLHYALLIGSDRHGEAIEALRRDSDLGIAEQHHQRILATPGEDQRYIERWARREKKWLEAWLQTEREHLAMLEAEYG